MRALLTPEIAPRMGIVLFRPGSELMPLFMQGRVLLEPEPERYSSFASGAVPAASQPLADDPAVRAVFRNEAVIRRAGGVECLESWLLREKGCQWPHSDWHSENMTTMRHAPGAIRLCWHCDNQLRDQFTERLESMATDNCARWVLSVVRRDLGFDDSHVVTMPELCWWLIRNDLADALPESAARKALRLPKPVVPSVTRESDLVPSVPATSIIQDKAKKVLALKVDPESPESFMLRPKRRRWVNEKYTRWVKTQPCACCGKPADDPHHLIGHGQGGMGTKAHDLFVLPLCRKHHDELHADMGDQQRQRYQVQLSLRQKYQQQLEQLRRDSEQKGTYNTDDYRKAEQALTESLNRQLNENRRYWQQLEIAQGNWKNGAMRAFQNFTADADNAAGTAEQMLTAAFNSAGNALATFCTTGKLNFKSFTASLLSDLAKIMAQMSMMQAVKGIGSAFGWGSAATASVTPNADGGVYQSADLSRYSGTVVNRPTFFAFAKGAGVMGEAGPEAILPLRRGADGKLGVVADIGGSGMAMFAPQYNIEINNDGTNGQIGPAALKVVYDLGKKAAADFMQQQSRDGGLFSGGGR
ncbi:TPA: phage tail tape measure protein [Escherichia coli]|nr:phage tail tape measure protein [Escherichia coli]